MRFFEGGCWTANEDWLSVSRCFEENFDQIDQWTYDEDPPGSKKLINTRTGKCLTSLEKSQLRLQNCTEKSSNQQWILIQYD